MQDTGSRDLVEVDEAVKEKRDPTGGRGLNGHITGKLDTNASQKLILEAAV